MSGIFHRNIDLMHVSIAVIPIMVSLNAPSLLTKIGLIRPRPTFPRMEAVVEAEVDAAAEVALLAAVMLVIEPTLAECGRAIMLRCLQCFTHGGIGEHNGKWRMVCKPCGWNTTHTTGFHDKWVADPKSFSLPATHLFRSKSGKNPPEGDGGGSTTPTAAITTTAASVTSDRTLSSHIGPLIAQYKTNTEDGQFASFLADFERASN